MAAAAKDESGAPSWLNSVFGMMCPATNPEPEKPKDPPSLMDPEHGYAYRMVHGVCYPPFASEAAIDRLMGEDWSREGDVLIATYPKCGTTWMQQMVLLLLAKGDASKVTDPMEQSPWVDREFSIATRQAKGDAAKIDAAFDKLVRGDGDAGFGGRRTFKTHAPYALLPCAGRFSKGKIIVVTRNPKDACASMYKHYLGLPAFKYTGPWDHFVGLFLDGNVGQGSWFDHVLGWRTAKDDIGDRLLFLSFEDMKADVETSVKRIAAFIDVDVDDELLAKVVAASSFDSMKKDHERRKSTGVQRMGSATHFRSGASGGWRANFTVAQSDALDAQFEARMAGTDIVTDFGKGDRFVGTVKAETNGH